LPLLLSPVLRGWNVYLPRPRGWRRGAIFGDGGAFGIGLGAGMFDRTDGARGVFCFGFIDVHLSGDTDSVKQPGERTTSDGQKKALREAGQMSRW
jgi:hypothetical protein